MGSFNAQQELCDLQAFRAAFNPLNTWLIKAKGYRLLAVISAGSLYIANSTSREISMIIEACVESLEEALYAQEKGAQQIELCARLDLDGLTPERELILEIQEKTDLKIKVMIRARGGNFVHSPEEIAVMEEDIHWCKEQGIADIVLGVLTKSNEIDLANLKFLAGLEPTLSITFHKAIDLVNDPILSIQQLCTIPNIDYILSSGQQATAWEGRVLLKKMQEVAGDQLQVIVAGKVTPVNINKLQNAIGARYYHGRRIV